LINLGLVIYAATQIGLSLTPANLLYSVFAVLSGVLVFGSAYLLFASTAFWTGQSKSAIWLIFRMSDFRKYPFSIYGAAVQVVLVTLIPIAFASFFPVTFILGRGEWFEWQIATLIVGPVFYYIAYRFWKFGLTNYSSTGS
jgi:ABC-2 type transport system permease protein